MVFSRFYCYINIFYKKELDVNQFFSYVERKVKAWEEPESSKL